MYSTFDGARRRAKELKRQFDRSSISFSLANCQEAVARSAGFKDWHDMKSRIGQSGLGSVRYDYVGALTANLPEPCRFTVLWDAIGRETLLRQEEDYRWAQDVAPYLMAMEAVHRVHSTLLRPGSGRDQRLRLKIVSGMLLDVHAAGLPNPKLDPVNLTISFPGHPRAYLSEESQHAGFARALDMLTAAGILEASETETQIFAPQSDALKDKLLSKARKWGRARMPDEHYAAVKAKKWESAQSERPQRTDFTEKTPYDETVYQGLTIGSRYNLAHEFGAMRSVVDAMPVYVRRAVQSIWCNSKACADYAVELDPHKFYSGLPEDVRIAFLDGGRGFNGLWVRSGEDQFAFDPEWPEDEVPLEYA